MPEGMPYTIEKGPYLSVVEDFVNGGDVSRAVQALYDLRAGASIAGLPPLSSPALAGGPYTPAQLVGHVNADWFGWPPQPGGGHAPPQDPFHPVLNPTTGYWRHWYGDCEAVFRETLIRALEVVLGLDHGATVGDGKPARRWWLELFWKCPQPWFEGWVTWRRHGKGQRAGQVTVLISTPGHGDPIKLTPLRRPGTAGQPYEEDPQTAAGTQGIWVVSQERHRPFVPVTTAASPSGQWVLPVLHHESQGRVVVVAPAEDEGGVLPGGRKFT